MIDTSVEIKLASKVDVDSTPRIIKMVKISSDNGVFSNVWAIADTDSCGDPDCGCDHDCDND